MPRFCREIAGIVRPPLKSLVIPQSYRPKRFSRIAGGECCGGSVPVTLIRLSLFVATVLVAGGGICAAQTQIPLPQAKPAAITPAPKAKATEQKATDHKGAERKATEHKATERKEQTHKGTPAPLSLSPGTLRGATTASVPNPAGRANVTPPAPAMPPPLLRSTPALAMATSAATSPLDLNALKQAVDLVGKSRSDEAANLENSMSDPLARKLIEWLGLGGDDTTPPR